MSKRHRKAGDGEIVSQDYAEANPLTTVSETIKPQLAEKFLKRLAKTGGAIVSSNDLSAEDIAEARAGERMFVDDDGFGYIYQPID